MNSKEHAAICANMHTDICKHLLSYSLSTSDLAVLIACENTYRKLQRGVNAWCHLEWRNAWNCRECGRENYWFINWKNDTASKDFDTFRSNIKYFVRLILYRGVCFIRSCILKSDKKKIEWKEKVRQWEQVSDNHCTRRASTSDRISWL